METKLLLTSAKVFFEKDEGMKEKGKEGKKRT